MKKTLFALTISSLFIASTAYGEWDSSLEKDEMTDESFGIAATSGSPNSIIGIQCQQDAEIIVVVQMPSEPALKNRITYRVDKGEVDTVPGFGVENGVGLLGPAKRALIPEMLSGGTLKVQGTKKNGDSTTVYSFSLSGVTAAFEKACSWHPGYSKLAN